MGHAFAATALGGVVAAALICAPKAGAAVELRGAVPTEYGYYLAWDPHARILAGRGKIRVSNEGPQPIRSVWVRLRPNDPGRIEQIRHFAGATVAERRAGGSMVRMRLKSLLAAGRKASFSFDLKLRVPRDDTSLGSSAGMDLFGDALPVVAVEGPRGIRVGSEPAYGEGSFNAVADWTVQIAAPPRMEVLLPGSVVGVGASDSRSFAYESTARVRDFAFAIGKATTLSRQVGHVTVEVAGSSQTRSQLPAALRRAVNAFKKMQGWYGGYDLPALRVVVGDLEFGGSEYPGLVFSTPDNATISHEVAHQWFYGLVGNDQYYDPFLDESLTAFAEQRFHHSYRCNLASPIDGRAHGLGTGMDYWQKHPAAYVHTIYRGGACALTVLQNDLGRDVFDRALRAYVAANANKIAGIDDFLAAIRQAAPGYDLARWERLVGLS